MCWPSVIIEIISKTLIEQTSEMWRWRLAPLRLTYYGCIQGGLLKQLRFWSTIAKRNDFFSKPWFFGLFIKKLVRGGIDPGRTKILKTTNNDKTNRVKMTEILHNLILIENIMNTRTLTQRKRGVYKFKIKVIHSYFVKNLENYLIR